MRIVIAPDSFKESLPAPRVAGAIAVGLRRALPQAELIEIPLADGGEGTARILVQTTGGRMVELMVSGPLGTPVKASYGLLGDGQTAVIEMAEAAGLQLVPPQRRNPRLATTRGVGELLRDALERGIRRIVVGLGGSATNDAGAGMAQALGFSLRDGQGNELPPGGAALAGLASIVTARCHPALEACEILAACDVTNPLCGPQGASRTYGPQKGAGEQDALALDAALEHFGRLLETQLGIPILNLPGGGAAGGLGAGLAAFAHGQLRQGFDLVARLCSLAERIQGAELIVTGEGALDEQTVNGKVPMGVARLAQAQGIPVIALAGALGQGYRSLYARGLAAAFSICPGPMPLREALSQTEERLADTAEAIGRLWAIGHK
jgi:glycerate kinase